MARNRIVVAPPSDPVRSLQMSRRTVRAPLMSNTKWHKLFRAIEQLGLDIRFCCIKWVDVETPQRRDTPRVTYEPPAFPYLDSERGPFRLTDIEWIEFPRVMVDWAAFYPGAPMVSWTQDVERAEQLLRPLAQFPMELTSEGLLITGHVR